MVPNVIKKGLHKQTAKKLKLYNSFSELEQKGDSNEKIKRFNMASRNIDYHDFNGMQRWGKWRHHRRQRHVTDVDYGCKTTAACRGDELVCNI